MEHKLTRQERKILRDDILVRYDNEEYWDLDVLGYIKGEVKYD